MPIWFPATIMAATSAGSTTTWSAVNKASGVTLSPDKLTATGPATYGGYATAGISSGKFYYEAQFTNFGSIPRIGVCDSTWPVTNELGGDTKGISVRPDNGNVFYAGGNPASGLFTGTTSDRICVAWDHASHTIWFRKNNGNWDNNVSDNPATGVGGYANFTPTGTAYPAYEVNGATASVTVYFDSASWLYSAPSGFSALP